MLQVRVLTIFKVEPRNLKQKIQMGKDTQFANPPRIIRQIPYLFPPPSSPPPSPADTTASVNFSSSSSSSESKGWTLSNRISPRYKTLRESEGAAER